MATVRTIFSNLLSLAIVIGGLAINSAAAQSCDGVTEVPASECSALLSIYSQLRGVQWADRWFHDTRPCGWRGITCRNGQIAELRLSDSAMTGELPREFAQLSALTVLSVSSFGILGSVPDAIGNISSLEEITLNGSFSGPIPSALSRLHRLQRLSLSGYFEGPIPHAYSILSNLEDLSIHLRAESAESAIPDWLPMLPNLRLLSFNGAGFRGEIPSSIGQLSNLVSLTLHSVPNLTGPLPSSLGNLSRLQSLILYLSAIDGPIPVELASLSELRTLVLANSRLTGIIPPELGSLIRLTYLDLSRNELSGAIPVTLGNLTGLTNLLLQNNHLSGSVPDSFSALQNLTQLVLRTNQFSGEFPSVLRRLPGLTQLYIDDNQFSGHIPEWIGELSQLIVLFMHDNQFRGAVPAGIGLLHSAANINLSNNKLTCPLPATIIQLGTNTIQLGGNDGVIAVDPQLISFISTHPNIILGDGDLDQDGVHGYYEDHNRNCNYDDDDSDADGTPDYRDVNDDNDEFTTPQEYPDRDGDRNPSDADDNDQNGIRDYLERGPYLVRGVVVDGNGQRLANVVIDGGALGSRRTNSAGEFVFGYQANGTIYRLSATLDGYSFNQLSGTVAGDEELRIIGTVRRFLLSGQVRNSSGGLVEGVRINAGTLGEVMTDVSGRYEITLPYRTNYTLTPESTNYSFTPASRSGVVLGDSEQDFVMSCALDVDGDGVTDCAADRCPNNPRLAAPNACGCRYFDASTSSDSDGDGVDNAQEIIDQTNECDTGSFFLRLRSPAYSKYNTFLDQQNFLELLASGSRAVSGRVTIYAIDGTTKAVLPFNLLPGEQRDFDIHSAVAQANTYGLVKIEFNDTDSESRLQGRMSQYRYDSQHSRYSFAFARELRNATRGRAFASANSFDPQGRGFLVANWAEVINLEPTAQRFTYRLYDQRGLLRYSQQLELPPFAELDVQAGHEYGEGVYLVEFAPHNPDAQFLSAVSRYSSNNADPTSGNYVYAFSIDGKSGTATEQQALISNLVGGCWTQTNWVEIVNTDSQPTDATVEFSGPDGAELGASTLSLAGHSQYHLNASALLNSGSMGSVRVAGTGNNSLLAQSVVYFHDCASNNLQTAFTTPARIPGRNVQVGSYNRFLGMENLMVVSNHSLSAQTLAVNVVSRDGYNLFEEKQTPSQGTFVLRYGAETPSNTYGTVTLESSIPRSFTADILRFREQDGVVQFVMPTVVQ